uniref:Long chain N-acylphenylalanine synthase n=1 Tax=uncultured bacterium EC5 TaxID=672206 RepID=D3W8J7_9BACT|nr:long chain N-acylphenylalanine synthase [uncultured bacterium EC5]
MSILIRPCIGTEEYLETCRLIESIYRNHGYVEYLRPDEHPGQLFIAIEDGQIVGSVGVALASHQVLPTEFYFGVRVENVPDDVGECHSRQAGFEICKLGSVGKSRLPILKGLISAVYEYALVNGCRIGLACMKPRLTRILNEHLNIPLTHLNGEVVVERVEDIYRGYFLGDPRPQAVSFVIRGIPAYMSRMRAEIKGDVQVAIDGAVSHEIMESEALR